LDGAIDTAAMRSPTDVETDGNDLEMADIDDVDSDLVVSGDAVDEALDEVDIEIADVTYTELNDQIPEIIDTPREHAISVMDSPNYSNNLNGSRWSDDGTNAEEDSKLEESLVCNVALPWFLRWLLKM